MNTSVVFAKSKCGEILLETRISFLPDLRTNVTAAVIAHPYGPLGGDFNNNVVISLHQCFTRRGFLTISFNFRGCGQSKGRTSWAAESELADYQSIVDLALTGQLSKSSGAEFYPAAKTILLCGYSYGSMIAGAVNVPAGIDVKYLLISYPLSVMWSLTLFGANKFLNPVKVVVCKKESNALFLHGDRDQFTSSEKFKKWLIRNDVSEWRDGNAGGWKVLPDVDHFWFDKEQKLLQILESWLKAMQL